MNPFEIAAIGLQQDTERLRVLSHNVANISTVGYKRQIAVQGAFMDAMVSAIASQPTMSTQTDLGAGKLRSTTNPLDVALSDRDFLMVRTASGASALTRGGALQIDAGGRLVTSSGLPVQGTNGDLLVPAGSLSIRINGVGQLLADDKVVGSLGLTNVAKDALLEALGDGLFRVPDVAHATSVQSPRINVGNLETSNVVSSQEMVQVMATTRHAESMVRLMQGADELLGKTISKLGEMQ